MRKRLAQILTTCFMAGVIAGCASSSPSRFYTLNSTLSPAVPPQTNVSVSVGPVSIPAAIDRPQIVVRTGPNMVSLAEFDRWASPLKEDIARTVVKNLIAILGTPQVTVFPQSMAVETSYRVGMDVLRFESEPGKGATLDSLWTVSSRKDGQSRSGRTTITEPAQSGGYAELVAAHSRALGQLSSEIAKTIREMEAQKP